MIQVTFKLYTYGTIHLREITRGKKLLCGVFTPVVPAISDLTLMKYL